MDFKHTSIKQSALGWVKKSIDDNLATIRNELNIYIEEKDASLLSSVQEKLGDLQGVLSMIEQYGAALLTEEMRSLCLYIASKEQQDQQALEVLLRAVLQLPDYLEHIQAGQKDILISILPLLNDIRAAKNEDLFSEKLLFLPDLSMHSDDGEYDAIDESKNQATRLLAKKLRPSYQYSILGLIKDKDVDANLARLGKITEVMEGRSSSEQVARLWWIVGALIESVSRDNLPLGVSVKMLLGKVDLIFRSMILKGEKELIRVQPIELIKNLLFYIAQPECDGPKSLAIKTAYRLEQFLPTQKDRDANSIAGPNQELLKTVSIAVKADLEEVKSTLEVYVNGDVNNTALLENLPRELHIISDTLAMIGLGPQRQLIESQIVMITNIIEGTEPPEEEKLLAMAAELIQVDQALELLHKGQYQQAGEDSSSTSSSRNFEMDNMLSAVVTAALDDIQKIKGAILDFIKDSSKEENIHFCQVLLHETRGALELLNEKRAASLTDGLIEYLANQDIVEFLDTNRLDQLSQVVVSIEYYLEAVGEQRSDADSILDFADSQLQLLLEGQKPEGPVIESDQEDQGNLLIDNSEIDEADKDSLSDVGFSNGIAADAHAEVRFGELSASDEAMDFEDISEIEIPVVESGDENTVDEVVHEINTNLEEIQNVLSSETELSAQQTEQATLLESDSDLSQADESMATLESNVTEIQGGELIETEVELEQPEAELESEAGFESETGLESEIEFETEVELESEAGFVPEGESESEIEFETEVELESETGFVPEGESEFEIELESEVELESEKGLVPEGESEPEVELDSEAGFEPEAELLSEAVSEPEAELEPEVEFESEVEFEAESDAKSESLTVEVEGNTIAVFPVKDDLEVLKPGSDPEILEIYLEEAEEETENIKQLQQDWKLHPEDENALKNIRRAFHTIKGSGRLVGAMRIGEFAWDFEDLLNRIIDKTILPTEQAISAVGQAAEALSQLVKELENGTPVTDDIPYLRGLARALSQFKIPQDSEKKISDNSAGEEEAVPSDTIHNLEMDQEHHQLITETGDDSERGDEEAILFEEGAEAELELLAVSNEESVKDSEQEETPPDPFVLSEIVDIPGTGVGQHLPDEPSKEVELNETTDLQIDPELLIIYQQEVESHLDTVNSVLNQPTDEGGLRPTEELYRAIHTINGASRTADITSIGLLATLLEKPLKIILEQGAGFDEEVLELYRKGHDAIQQMTKDLVESRRLPELPEMLRMDLENLMDHMDQHTVELIDSDNQASNQFVDTLTMMNESVESDFDEDEDELVDIFIEEAGELLDMSDHNLQLWAEQDDSDEDIADFGLVMELQRYLHTLKGGAKMAGLKQIGDLSHELESLLIAVIDGRVDKSGDLIDALHDSFDLLSSQVVQAKNHQALDSSSNQIGVLQQLRRGNAPQQESAEKKTEIDQQTVIETSPTDVDVNVLDETQSLATAEAPETDRRGSDRDVVKVRSELLDNLVNSAGEVSIYRARMEQQVSSFGSNLGELGQTISRLKNQLRALEAETDAQIHFSHKDDAEGSQDFDPLEMDRYTQIHQLSKSLSESVEDLSSLQSILGEQVKDSETLLLQQSRINTDLQDGLIRSRMVHFSSLTSRLRRLVRKTSSELAKKAELVIEGDENEVDIKVLDRMVAPIEHILRNSISHGIESPIERLNKGKPKTGTIKINVSRDGSDVVLKISDDGAGVNVKKIRSRAIQLGMLGEHEKIDDNDVIRFILEPGFSTAEQVTQVAGRGVGMDVVDSSIKQLGGSLQISTSPGGSEFTARLPFTLSIHQAILVQAGDESYALPLINIEGITRIESDHIFELYQQEKPSLDYAGQHYSLYYLSSLLGISSAFEVSNDASKEPVILLRSGDLRVALHIDVLLGNREIVVKPLGKLLSQVKGISGASILADGRVVLILDINGLIRHGVISQILYEGAEQTVKHLEIPEKDVRKLVMVVDDSITMRRVATKLLTRHNYEVITAKDGIDALAQLEDANPDVMLLDIEMPRMDGFELATHMKNEARFQDIPIIMITSRTGSKHRDHAMKIGVDKYMGKPYQEDELIQNISELAG